MKSISSILLLVLSLSALHAEDLNWQAAERAYKQERAKADSAKQQRDNYYSIYQSALSRLNSAKQREENAEQNYNSEQNQLVQIDNSLTELERQNSNLQNDIYQLEQFIVNYQNQMPGLQNELRDAQRELNHVQKRLDRVNQRIQELENQPHEGIFTCTYRDQGHEEHSGGHSASANDRSHAEELANTLCLSFHGKCKLVRCSQQDTGELGDLKRERNELDSQRNNLQSTVNNINSQISNIEFQVNDLQRRINQNDQTIRQNNLTISSLGRDRDRKVIAIQRAHSEWQTAQNNVSFEDSNMRRAYSDYQSADQSYQFAESSAAQAYAYYQEVIANYNAALESVMQRATLAANNDSLREASDRAPEAAKSAGSIAGRTEGIAKGEIDGGKREFVAGYLAGISAGSTEPSLLQSYQTGIKAGQVIASQKAQAENFPRGFNEALRTLLSGIPAQSESVDISESISSQSGGNGVLLNLSEKSIGSVPNPKVTAPNLPIFEPPTAGTPNFSVPQALKTHFSPPCSGLVLSEFESQCRDRYQSVYLSAFASQYQSSFMSFFRSSFAASSWSSYESTLTKNFGAQLIAGKKQGALDQGILDGFESSLATMGQEKFLAGKNQLQIDLSGGALLVVRGASLIETSGDGIFTPGELLKLSVSVDNYGLQDTALEKLRIKVKGVLGVNQLNFAIRNLPALRANTRTVLTGVVQAVITTSLAKEQMELSTSLEALVNNEWKEIAQLNATSETHFPTEITNVVFAKNPVAGVNNTAVFTIKNLTKNTIAAAKIALDSAPNFIKFIDKESELSELQSGQETQLSVAVQPTNSVPENSYVKFVATKEGVQQGFAKYVRMDRTLGLEVYDKSMKAIPSSTLKVKAGTTVQLFIQPVYLATVPLNGPFSMLASKTSDPRITFGGGSTTGIQWGSLSPKTVLEAKPLNYQLPEVLKGTTQWILVQANEGSKVTHAMTLFLEVQ